MSISLADIQRWDPEQINEVAEAAAARARTSREKADELFNLSAFSTWSGDAASAAQEAITESRTKLELSAQEAFLVSLGASRAYQEAQAVTREVREILAYAAEAPAVEVNTVTNSVIPPDTTGWAPADVATVVAKIAELKGRITAALAHAEATDADLARVLSGATGDDDVNVGTDTHGPDDPERRQASAKAFEEVYGRPPASAEDWVKASWLDPANDDPALKGTESSVVVTDIKPVPGHGVVRGSLFIMDEKVVDPFGPNGYDPRSFDSLYDYGNNRGFSENFDPRNAKGAFLIDYENGVVIFRQNPTHDTAGHVSVGEPDVRVTQAGDGAVRMDYHLPNPGSMLGPVNMADASGKPVTGTVLVSPGESGPSASGFIGDYPSAEIYVDRPDGSVQVLLQDEQDNRTVFGPILELGSYHFVGELPGVDVQRELGFSPTQTEFRGPGGSIQVRVPLDVPTVGSSGTRLTPP